MQWKRIGFMTEKSHAAVTNTVSEGMEPKKTSGCSADLIDIQVNYLVGFFAGRVDDL